jgi:hypothetical protein
MQHAREAQKLRIGLWLDIRKGKSHWDDRRHRWEDNIKMDVRELGWSAMNLINLAQDSGQWRALGNLVGHIRV